MLDLSFLGWLLLSVVPFVILWTRPYMTVASAGFYDEVIPAFWEEVKNRPIAAPMSAVRPGEWSVPGETPGEPEEPEEPEEPADDSSDGEDN